MPLLHRAIDLHTGVTEMHRDEKREGPGCKSYFRGPVDPQGGETEARGRPESLTQYYALLSLQTIAQKSTF